MPQHCVQCSCQAQAQAMEAKHRRARRVRKQPVKKSVPEEDNDTSLIICLKSSQTAKRRDDKRASKAKKPESLSLKIVRQITDHNNSFNSCNVTPNQPLEKENSYYGSKTQVTFGRVPNSDFIKD